MRVEGDPSRASRRVDVVTRGRRVSLRIEQFERRLQKALARLLLLRHAEVCHVVSLPRRPISFFFSSRRRHTRSVSAFLLNRSSDLLTSNKVWIATDRSRARRCVEACVYGTLDFVGYPRFPAPVEFIAAVIAYYVHPVNIQTACLIMEGAEFTENIINGVERPVKAAELFAFTLRVRAGNTDVLTDAEENVRQKLRAEGVM